MSNIAYQLKAGVSSVMTGVEGSFDRLVLNAGDVLKTADKAVQAVLDANGAVERVPATPKNSPAPAADSKETK